MKGSWMVQGRRRGSERGLRLPIIRTRGIICIDGTLRVERAAAKHAVGDNIVGGNTHLFSDTSRRCRDCTTAMVGP